MLKISFDWLTKSKSRLIILVKLSFKGVFIILTVKIPLKKSVFHDYEAWALYYIDNSFIQRSFEEFLNGRLFILLDSLIKRFFKIGNSLFFFSLLNINVENKNKIFTKILIELGLRDDILDLS